MHERPSCVHSHVCHTSTPRMFSADGFDISVLYGVGEGNSIVRTNRAVFYVDFPSVTVNVSTYLATTILISYVDAVPDLF